MNDDQALKTITDLSHEFGADTYVRGGGGNTSCKNAETLFIKPSGTTLSGMTPGAFLGLDRKVLAELYSASFPSDPQPREAAVVEFMTKTVRPEFSGRPSVEAPLHNSFPQRFVVHTHPAEVNGMTCGNDGAATCARLFPKALWVNFFEPGYTLCMRIREEMDKYAKTHGKAPDILFLESHGVFIAHDEADGIRNLYEEIMYGVRETINNADRNHLPAKEPAPTVDKVVEVAAMLEEVMGEDARHHVADGRFATPEGPITPDHIVYCKSFMFKGEPTPEALRAFKAKYGYWPRVVETPGMVLGLGSSRKTAELALELAWDGAVTVNYAGAFGGIHYLEKKYSDFIENWEVESYRRKVAE